MPPSAMGGEFDALNNEYHLVRYLAYSGLTALRRAEFQSLGSYFEAFFAITVSLERAAKLVLAHDVHATSGTYPTDAQMRGFGHGLVALEGKVAEIVARRALPVRWNAPSAALDTEALQFLDDFASASKDRYYNLSFLAALASGVQYDGPPARWTTLIKSHLTQRQLSLTPREIRFVAMQSYVDSTGLVLVQQSREDGTALTSLAEGQEHYFLNMRVQKHGTLAVVHHLRFVIEALRCIAPHSPDVWDYFVLLLNEDRLLSGRKTFK